MKQKELAAESGLESYGAGAMAIKRNGTKLTRDAGEAARMNRIVQMLNVKMWCARRSCANPRVKVPQVRRPLPTGIQKRK
jgi:hypothetical protein